MKLVVLGGGGVRSPFLAKSIALGAEKAGITQVAFMDINGKKLNTYGKIARRIFQMIAPEIPFSLTLDAREALTGADYVITTIRAEGDEGRVFDERTALNHGILGQETTGAGGFAMALRSIHVLLDYCALMKQVSSPDVLVFNFTNPSGLVTQALRTRGYDMVYGVCDAPSGFKKQLAGLLPEGEFQFRCYGLNHLSWFDRFTLDGSDVGGSLRSHPDLYRKTEMRLFDPELVQFFRGALPNEYLYFYYYRERAVESILRSKKTRGETILEINRHMEAELDQMDVEQQFDQAFDCFMRHYAMREDSYFAIESGRARETKWATPTAREYVAQPDQGGYAAVALEFIQALHTGQPVNMVLSVPNQGAMPGLAPEDVAELSCVVDRQGVHPVPVEEIPPMQMDLIRLIKLYENLTAEAILERDRRKAVQALTVHPLVNSYSLAESLVDAYADQYKEYIGVWRN